MRSLRWVPNGEVGARLAGWPATWPPTHPPSHTDAEDGTSNGGLR